MSPAIYLIYIDHYGVNSPAADEWLRIPLLHAAVHGHLAPGALWAQYNESRIFVANLIFVASAVVDHFDLRTLMFFNAAVFIVSFWLFLVLFRAYEGKRPAVVAVLIMGAVWFSPADVTNPLWAFQVPWFLVVLLFIAMSYLLLVPQGHRNMLFALAMLASVTASLSTIQGFVLWPVGLICLLWINPRVRRTFYECGTWIAAATVTIVSYSFGFNFTTSSGLKWALAHPIATARYFLVMIGNVIPSGYLGTFLHPPTQFGMDELRGGVLLIVALVVVVLGVRERRTQQRIPVPILLISFAILFDVMISLGRANGTLLGALDNNRYVMPNLILLLGIIAYALAQVSAWRRTPDTNNVRFFGRSLMLGALAIFFVVQVVVAAQFGIRNGNFTTAFAKNDARLVVNLDRIPPSARGCELNLAMFSGIYTIHTAVAKALPILADARADHLSIFQLTMLRTLRAEGPPVLDSQCTSPRAP